MRALMSFVQRVIVLALLIALGIWLFYIGREHQVFLDNRTVERDGVSFKALEQVNVSVNGGEATELLPRDRDVAKVVGPVFRVKAEVFNANGDVEKVIEREIRPEFEKNMMLSLPLMAADREDFLLPPPGLTVQAAPDETPPAAPEERLSPGSEEPVNP